MCELRADHRDVRFNCAASAPPSPSCCGSSFVCARGVSSGSGLIDGGSAGSCGLGMLVRRGELEALLPCPPVPGTEVTVPSTSGPRVHSEYQRKSPSCLQQETSGRLSSVFSVDAAGRGEGAGVTPF